VADNEPGPGARSRGPCEHGTPMTLLSSRARAASASAGAIGERVIGAVCCRSARAYLARRSAEGADGGAPAAPEGTAGEAPSAAEGDGDVNSGGESEGAGAAGVGDAGSTADNAEVASCCRSARTCLARGSAEGADGGAPAAPEGAAGEAPPAAEGDGDVNRGGELEDAEAAGAGDAGSTADNAEVARAQETVEDGAEDTGARGAAAGDASDLRCSRRRTARAAAHSAVRMEAASGSSGEP
jgi:nicotinate-nucleotide--dimethylbenzimidazole phosphoribosyltransferase